MQDLLERLPHYEEQLRAIKETIITNIVLIGQVPSITFKEKQRAHVFMDRLAENQVDECTTDGYRNPIGVIRGRSKEKPPIFVVAHMDTFFEKDIVYNFRVTQNSITGPGILDNSLSIGVMASLPYIFRTLDIQFESDVVIAGVIQSIGKGNLRGIRHLLKTWATPIRGAVCLEGVNLGRLNYYSDGMIRCEIECRIRPQIRISRRFRPNAILIINDIINQILSIRLPQRPRTQIVVGKIAGGVNHGGIPYEANLGFEIRSDSYKMVRSVFNNIGDIVEGIGHENEVDMKLKTISHLKASRLKFSHPLVKGASAVIKSLGIEPLGEPSESELSIFLSQSIPAVTIGITRGENQYTENARMEIDPMFTGIAQLIGILQVIDSGVCDEK
jgi:acetylornithine deacetylase/succinyl-diaminopimelate desuccinylase-like protein